MAIPVRYFRTSLTGGTDFCMDNIDGARLNDGDTCVVVAAGVKYEYWLSASSGATENSPLVISPDTTDGNKRWLLVSAVAQTAADNTATTQLATTAFAKSQDAVLARLPDQAVSVTAAASGSSGIAVADNDNIDFGTGNFTLVWRGSLPNWNSGSIQYLMSKFQIVSGSDIRGFLLNINATGKLDLNLLRSNATAVGTSTITIPFVYGTTHEIICAVVRETAIAAGSVTFYIDGVLFETIILAAGSYGTISSNQSLYLFGRYDTDVRYAGTCSFAATYNRALTAAEVLDLYRNGPKYEHKRASQTALTSGTLLVGQEYTINAYVSNDDFTNVGAASNATGVQFVATGTTPTHWAHSSSLRATGGTLILEPEGIQNDKWYDSSSNTLNASYPTTGWSLTRRLNWATLPTGANNAAAAAAGVLVGGLYRTNADPSVLCTRTA